MSEVEARVEPQVIIKRLESPDEKNRREKMEIIQSQGSVLGKMSFILGVLYAFFLYKNPCGITYPLFVGSAFGIWMLILKKLDIRIKKGSLFLAGVALLIGISTCMTGDTFIINLNKIAVFLLMCIFMIHQFYDDSLWDLGKYMKSITIFILTAISLIGYPMKHFYRNVCKFKKGKCKSAFMVLIGIGCSIPAIMILIFLLGQADMVFGHLVETLTDSYFRPWTLISVSVKAILGAVACYCLISGAYIKNLSEEVTDRRKQEPLIAISGLVIIALVYLVFSGIQIIYLFLGFGNLPEGVTYSSYARQGFFQLLFVVCLNLFMVLLCLKYFKPHWILNGILTLVSLCTYVIIASAAYRMLLYVGEYHLTYLRVLVLWFLAMAAVFMTGVIILIYKNRFPLFRYGLVVVSAFYMALSFGHPDYVIASYNIAHMSDDEIQRDYYLKLRSVDALPAIISDKSSSYIISEWREHYKNMDPVYWEEMGIFDYNFAFAKAGKLIKTENEKKW